MRLLAIALAAGFAGVIPTIAGTIDTPWQANAFRVGGFAFVILGALYALTARGRSVSVDRGSLVLSFTRAPLRAAAERRIPARHVTDIAVQRVRMDDGGPAGFARYRYNVVGHLSSRRRPVRLLNLGDEGEAMRIAERLRDALAAGNG